MDYLMTLRRRTDWGRMRREHAALDQRLKFAPQHNRPTHRASPASILTDFAEGKLSLGEAVLELEQWKNKKVAEALTKSNK